MHECMKNRNAKLLIKLWHLQNNGYEYILIYIKNMTLGNINGKKLYYLCHIYVINCIYILNCF